MENQKSKIKNQNFNAGTTLVELIVVLAIFMVIIGIAVSIFISVLQQQSKVGSEQEFLNQTGYAMEYMSRAMRLAVKDTQGSCLQSGDIYLLTHYDAVTGFYNGVKFINSSGLCQEFFLDTDGVFKQIKGSAPAQNLLSSKFKMQYVRFVINGNKTLQAATGSNGQPRLTMILDAKVTGQNQQEELIQTTVSQRNLNI